MVNILRTSIFIALLMHSSAHGHAQRVQVKNAVQERDKLKINVAAILDTVSVKGAGIHFGLFANGGFDTSYTTFTKRNEDGWFTAALSDGPALKKGVHSFLISFPDSCTRVYQCLVTNAIKNNMHNMIERQYLPVGDGYATVLSFLQNKIRDTDSLNMMQLLPAGFKGAVCIDFFGTDVCVASQYLFGSSAPDAADGQQYFFREFFKTAGVPAIDALLSLGWQLKPGQFSRALKIQDVYDDFAAYQPISHANKQINEKIKIGYKKDDKGFSRILVFIDN